MPGYAKTAISRSELAPTFAATISAAHLRLLAIDEDASLRRRRPDAWSRREILGHLLDSAANNHLRIARAALEGVYEGPGYAQQEWIRLSRYHECGWRVLVAWWLAANQRLARLVANLPLPAFDAPCTVTGDITAPLGELIADYLGHIEHHLLQIES